MSRRKTLQIGGLSALLIVVAGVVWWKTRDPGELSTATSASVAPVAAPAASAVPPSLDGIALATADAAFVTVPSAANAWGGPRTDQHATLSDRVVEYRIEAKLDPDKHTLDGRQQLTWRNRSAVPVRSVYVHLYLNAFEGQGSTFMTEKRRLGFGFRSDVDVQDGDWGHIQMTSVKQAGQAVPWHFVQPDGGPSTDHTVVRMDLPQAVAPGASTALNIDFNAKLPRVLARTGHFGSFHLVGQWFPKIAVLELPGERGLTAPRWNAHEFHMHSEFYADYGLFDVAITVPKGYRVGATGEPQGAPVEQDGWVTQRFVQGDVHDFAWTADKRFAEPLTATWRHAPDAPEVKVTVLFPPEYAQNAQPVLKATLDSLTYFSDTLGRYPYKTVTAVVPPWNAEEAGGMEYPTFFTASSYANSDAGTMNGYQLDFVTIHEFGHGYFYGILGSNEFEEPMLDEGLNEYWNLRMIRDRGQQVPLTTAFLRKLGLGSQIDAFAFERLQGVLGEPLDPLGANSWHRYSSGSYGSVYARTASALRDLEAQLGKDATEKAFKAYYQAWKFRHPSIADLQASLSQSTGKPDVVAAIFNRHVYTASRVDDRIEKIVSEEELPLQAGTSAGPGGWKELTSEDVDKRVSEVRKAWKKANPNAKKGDGPFPWRSTVEVRRAGIAVPQTVVLRFEDGTEERFSWADDSRWKRFSVVKPAKLVSAELDPLKQNLMDTRLLDNGRTAKADRAASTRWTLEGASLIHTLFALVATL